MKKKLIAAFLISFVFFCLLLQSISHVLNNEQAKIDAQQIGIIQENVKDRFKLYLQMPLSLAIIGSDYFSSGDLTSKPYGNFFSHVLKINKEILGLNVMNREGKIIKVYPERKNDLATGKISQNTLLLKDSLKKGEEFWLSPPFQLYQGETGFAFYVPIMKGTELTGWFATVITTREFIQQFSLKEFLKTYELNIKDAQTGVPYFATAITPENGHKIYDSESEFFGRKVIFESWRKTIRADFTLPLHWRILLAFVLALITTQVLRVIQLRKKSQEQLEDIGILLRLTSNEALSNLVDAEASSPNESSEQTGYLNNLLEQINLLQTMAKEADDLYQDRFSLTAAINEQIKQFSEIISKKKIELGFNLAPLNDLMTANKWLIEHSVLNNVLSHAIVQARPESSVLISSSSDKEIIRMKIEVPKIQEKRLAINWDRRMEVARKTLNIYQGDLSIENNDTQGMILHLTIKKA